MTEQVGAAAELRTAERAHAAGDHVNAARALERVARAGAAQHALEAAERYAVVCDSAGDLESAITYVVATLSFPADLDLPELDQADSLRTSGDLARAQARYEQLTDHGDVAVSLTALGRLAKLRSETGDAPGVMALLLSRLGLIHRREHAPQRARAVLRAAAETGEPTALYRLGQVLLEDGEAEKGCEVLVELAELDSGLSRRALVEIGSAYARAGDAGQAREMYVRALEHPGEPDEATCAAARMHLGHMAKGEGNWPEARHWYQQVLDSGSAQQGLAAAHLGEIAYWLDEYGEAVLHYERTLATGTRNTGLIGEAAYRLGAIHHARGDVDVAKGYLRQAIHSGAAPFAADAAYLLAQMD